MGSIINIVLTIDDPTNFAEREPALEGISVSVSGWSVLKRIPLRILCSAGELQRACTRLYKAV